MDIKKKLTYIIIFFAIVFLIYILFSTDGTKSKRKEKVDPNSLSFLFGGSGDRSSPTQAPNPMGLRGPESQSVFDSDFYRSGGFQYDDPTRQGGESTEKGEIPINPQTGKPYSEEAMEQFDRLREYFPDNELIPRRLTPELKAKQEAQAAKMAEVTRNVMSGNASRADLDYYYGRLEKEINDRLELIEYLIDTQGGGDEELDKKLQEVLDGIKAQMAQIQEEKQDAYKRAGY